MFTEPAFGLCACVHIDVCVCVRMYMSLHMRYLRGKEKTVVLDGQCTIMVDFKWPHFSSKLLKGYFLCVHSTSGTDFFLFY